MYTIVLVIATSVQNVGLFETKQQCEETVKSFVKQGVAAVCVKQAMPDQQLSNVMKMMQSFIKNMEQ